MLKYGEMLNMHIEENTELFKGIYEATDGKYFVRYSGENTDSWIVVSNIQACFVERIERNRYEVRVIIGGQDILVDVYDNKDDAKSLNALLLYSNARAEQEYMNMQRQILEQAQESVDSMSGAVKPDFSMN